MKKVNYILIIFLLCLSSCDDFLTRNPGNQTSHAEQLSTEEGVLQAVNGVYESLEEELRSRLFLYGDLQGGNITFTPNINGNNRGIVFVPFNIERTYNFQNAAINSDYNFTYEGLYEIIAAVNLIFSFLPEVEMSQIIRDRIISELTAIRAYTHFLLVNLYAQSYNYTDDHSHLGIAYIDRPLESGVDFPFRISIADTYDKIVNDLTTALNTGDGKKSLEFLPDYGYVSKTVIRTLLARVELYRGNYAAALEYSNHVISDSGELIAGEDYVAEWKKPSLPPSETIWEMPPSFNIGGGLGFSISSYFLYSFDEEGTTIDVGEYVISKDLVDLYTDTDLRKSGLIREINLATLVDGNETMEPYYFTEKFQDNTGVLILRLAEVYLIRAEANARLGNLSLAHEDLNLIRMRADVEALPLEGLSQTELLDNILMERRKELAMEGHLFFDMMRFQRDINRNQGCLSSRCNIQYPSNLLVLPIPASTILVNENMQQNEGY